MAVCTKVQLMKSIDEANERIEKQQHELEDMKKQHQAWLATAQHAKDAVEAFVALSPPKLLISSSPQQPAP